MFVSLHPFLFLFLLFSFFVAYGSTKTSQYIYKTDGTIAGKEGLMQFAALHQYAVEPLYDTFESPFYVVVVPTPSASTKFSGKQLQAHLTPLHTFALAQNHAILTPTDRKVDIMNRYVNPYAIPYQEVSSNFYVPSAVNRNVMHLNASKLFQTGAGIRVYIPDGGMQCEHQAFARSNGRSACNAAAGFSTCSDNHGTGPEDPSDVHATMCASLICASKFGGGLAPDATCVPRRYICNGGWSTIAEARANAVAEMAILSVSNGPPDGIHYYEYPLDELVVGIVETWIRGTMRVDAAGNGAIRGETCAADWTVSLQQTPGIAAITATGLSEQYSEKCPGVLVGAFGASGSNAIYTALADPSVTNAMSDMFDGTSAAAPQVAGVIALIRQAKPDVQPRDIVRALVATSRQQGLIGGAYPFIPNAAGFAHSLAFGFGYPDTYGAIAYVNQTAPLPPQRSCQATILDLMTNADVAFSDFTIVIPADCPITFIEYVNIHITFLFDDASDMGELSLVSPSGRRSIFLDSFHGYHVPQWNFFSGGWPWYGEPAIGKWTISIEALDDFRIAAATILLYGTTLNGK